MADVFTKSKRSQVMAAIRSSGNQATELKTAALFRKHGIIKLATASARPWETRFTFQAAENRVVRGRLFLARLTHPNPLVLASTTKTT